MKKKLSRLNVDELKQTYDVLDTELQRSVVGGYTVTSNDISGGKVVSYSWEDGTKYSVCIMDDGRQFVFWGAIASSGQAANGAAYQLNGTIHLGDDPSSIDMNTFIHEYGHYLQQKNEGDLHYVGVAMYSAYKSMFPGENYYTGSEKEASEYGQAYMDMYYPGHGYRAPGL